MQIHMMAEKFAIQKKWIFFSFYNSTNLGIAIKLRALNKIYQIYVNNFKPC